MEIIPAIDILEGKCVRLSQGDYHRKTIYHENPVDVALMFQDWGIQRLHLVDLEGAKSGHIVNIKTLADISSQTNLIIDFGGGIKSDEDIRLAFSNGASMVTIGSIAIKQVDLFLKWLHEYGPEKIILGADHRNGNIATHGWTKLSESDLLDFIEFYYHKGVIKIVCTDIARDGMMTGPDTEVYEKIIQRFQDLYLFASGGISDIKDLYVLEERNIPAVILGKSIYEGRITKADIETFLNI